MKKIFSLSLFLCLFPLFSHGLEYPQIMNNGTIFVNTGVGFGRVGSAPGHQVPPFTVSLDMAIPIAGLPFTLGLITGYFSESSTNANYMPIGLRTAFHWDFGVPRLDTYILMTLGGAFSSETTNRFWFGLSGGARYFFHPSIGGFVELGLDGVQVISFGLSFRI